MVALNSSLSDPLRGFSQLPVTDVAGAPAVAVDIEAIIKPVASPVHRFTGKPIVGHPRLFELASDTLKMHLNENGKLSDTCIAALENQHGITGDLIEEIMGFLSGGNLIVTKENVLALCNFADCFSLDILFVELAKNIDQNLKILSEACKNKKVLNEILLIFFLILPTQEAKFAFIEKLKQHKVDVKKFILPQNLTYETTDLRRKIFHEAFLDQLLENRGSYQKFRDDLHELNWKDFIELINLPPMYNNFVGECLKKLSSLKAADLETFKTNLVNNFPDAEFYEEQNNKLKAYLQNALEALKAAEESRKLFKNSLINPANLTQNIDDLKSKITEIDVQCTNVDKRNLAAVKIFQQMALTKLQKLNEELPIIQKKLKFLAKLIIPIVILLLLVIVGATIASIKHANSLPWEWLQDKYGDFYKSPIFQAKDYLIQISIFSSIIIIPGIPSLALLQYFLHYKRVLKKRHFVEGVDFKALRELANANELGNGIP